MASKTEYTTLCHLPILAMVEVKLPFCSLLMRNHKFLKNCFYYFNLDMKVSLKQRKPFQPTWKKDADVSSLFGPGSEKVWEGGLLYRHEIHSQKVIITWNIEMASDKQTTRGCLLSSAGSILDEMFQVGLQIEAGHSLTSLLHNTPE